MKSNLVEASTTKALGVIMTSKKGKNSARYKDRLHDYYEELSLNPDYYIDELVGAETFLENLKLQYGNKHQD